MGEQKDRSQDHHHQPNDTAAMPPHSSSPKPLQPSSELTKANDFPRTTTKHESVLSISSSSKEQPAIPLGATTDHADQDTPEAASLERTASTPSLKRVKRVECLRAYCNKEDRKTMHDRWLQNAPELDATDAIWMRPASQLSDTPVCV